MNSAPALEQVETLIVGAGPAGAVAAAMLRQRGRQVLVIEREQFPRFSIGESLLPQSMEYIEAAGLLRDVVEAGFQYKNGASFAWGERETAFDFRDKFSPGWGTTYQVQRANFDQVLASGAARLGAEVRFQHELTALQPEAQRSLAQIRAADGSSYQVQARYVLDASGFGRTLPRLLGLERPSNFPVRGALFTHIEDRVRTGAFDRNKIRITVHPQHVDVWFWLIPLADGRCSLGVVARSEFLQQYEGDDEQRLRALVGEDPTLRALLSESLWDTPVRRILGYASNVSQLCGPGYALLGNAGEFLDPVFSSGVTIAFKSASLAVAAIERELAGESVDWDVDYSQALRAGVDCFRGFVDAWYAGTFQKIIFHQPQPAAVRRMICSILAGYAWDTNNPYVAETKRRLGVLEALCA